jgi:hypothetical protein
MCGGQAQRNKETPGPGGRPQHVPSSSRSESATHTDDNEATISASMTLTSLHSLQNLLTTRQVMGIQLRRLPAHLHTVRHSGLERRTENKRSSVNDDLIECSGPVPM